MKKSTLHNNTVNKMVMCCAVLLLSFYSSVIAAAEESSTVAEESSTAGQSEPVNDSTPSITEPPSAKDDALATEVSEEETKDIKTKAIQQTLAGAIDPEKLDAKEETATEWPMQIPKIPVKFDWILLKKGELLGGDLFAMYQDRVEFDSDEVGIVSIKMKDILQIRTKTIMSVRFLDNSVLLGKLLITETKVTFIDYPDIVFSRNEILTMSPAEREGQSLWNGEFSVGLNFKSGNSPRFDYLFSAKASRLSSSGRFDMSYTGIYSEVENTETGEDVKTEENHRVNIGYDYFYNKKLYFRLPHFEYYKDDFKNIDIQSTLGVALGYEVIDKKIWDNKDIELNIYSGPSVQFTRFVEVEAGAEEDSTSPVLAFGLDFELDLTDKTEFFFVYDGKWVNKTSGSLISYLEVGIEIEIVDDFDIEIATLIDHVAEPTANELGEIPETTDTLFTVSLEYEF